MSSEPSTRGVAPAQAGVTAVIPFYNSSAALQRALTSVSDQTVPVVEIIVVDDASSPDERDRAREMVDETPRARLVTLEENGGAGEARNAGWDAAATEWVAFLDSDDAWHSRKIEYQLRTAARWQEPPALIACQEVVAQDVGELEALPVEPDPAVRAYTARELLVRNRWSASSVMVRRTLPVRFPRGRRYSEDYELWLVVSGLGRLLVKVEAPLMAVFKPVYGASGLSADLGRMALGELRAFGGARRAGAITAPVAVLAVVWSSVKSVRRMVRVTFRERRRFGPPTAQGRNAPAR